MLLFIVLTVGLDLFCFLLLHGFCLLLLLSFFCWFLFFFQFYFVLFVVVVFMCFFVDTYDSTLQDLEEKIKGEKDWRHRPPGLKSGGIYGSKILGVCMLLKCCFYVFLGVF